MWMLVDFWKSRDEFVDRICHVIFIHFVNFIPMIIIEKSYTAKGKHGEDTKERNESA